MSQSPGAQRGWQAHLKLDFVAGRNRTQMLPRRRVGPLLVQRPFYPEQNCCHGYLLHPPGGVVGGDELELEISVGSSAHALLTSPGATKFYQSAGDTALYHQRLSVEDGGMLEFLPHENIYFPGANVSLHNRIDLQSSSVTMLWEKHCFGRPVISESFATGEVTSRLDVAVDGDLVLTETQRINAAEIARASGLRQFPVTGSFLLYAAGLDKTLQGAVAGLSVQQGYAAVTRPVDSLLVIRYLGSSTADMNRYFVAVWQMTRSALTGKPAVQPRIWAT